MTNHYETLDAPRNATLAELRRAFRRASMHAHPDRGGSHERMAAVNAAWSTLSDPVKRAHYDATGEEHQGKPLRAMAIEALVAVFTGALDQDLEPIAHAKAKLAEVRGAMNSQEIAFRHQIAALRKRSGRTTTRNGAENLVQSIIDAKLANLTKNIAQLAEALDVNRTAEEMLSDYIAEEGPTELDRHMMALMQNAAFAQTGFAYRGAR